MKKLLIAVLFNLILFTNSIEVRKPTARTWLNQKANISTEETKRNVLLELSKLGREETPKNNIPSPSTAQPVKPKPNYFNQIVNEATQNLRKSASNYIIDIEEVDTQYITPKTKPTPAKQDNKQEPRGINHIKSIYTNLRDVNSAFEDTDINTVRYIPSVKSESNRKLSFVFNLSLLTSTERLIKSELYINKKHIRQRLKFSLNFYLIKNKTNAKLDSNSKLNSASTTIDLANLRGHKFKKQHGWQVFNIIDSVNSYLSVRNNRAKLLNAKLRKNSTVYFTLDKLNSFDVNEAAKSVSDEFLLVMEAFVMPRSKKAEKTQLGTESDGLISPYLIVYSNEEEKSMKKFFQSRLPAELVSNEQENRVSLKSELVGNEELKSLKSFEDHVDKMNELVESNEEEHGQMLPNDISYYSPKDKTIKIFEPLEEPKLSVAKKNASQAKSSPNSFYYMSKSDQLPSVGVLEKGKSLQEIEFLINDLGKPGIFRTNLKNRIKREADDYDESSLLPSSWDEPLESESGKTECKTLPITIDFSDLSFSDWVVEPKRFQSNYCAGACKFPLNEVGCFFFIFFPKVRKIKAKKNIKFYIFLKKLYVYKFSFAFNFFKLYNLRS